MQLSEDFLITTQHRGFTTNTTRVKVTVTMEAMTVTIRMEATTVRILMNCLPPGRDLETRKPLIRKIEEQNNCFLLQTELCGL